MQGSQKSHIKRCFGKAMVLKTVYTEAEACCSSESEERRRGEETTKTLDVFIYGQNETC